ncbi:hypothetical protein J056_004509 [Wallemia ichthyophaga EXF-994]|uniref:Uncharacterized protein n=1 Tax=Wallemia ichthyophaga (strain EXF-994 / CBS 113033) TaxID=1299270 RepID=R9AG67_WALI9|nr:uncharacterized protein J056_004509 [Wallemia ichthyophaga EXF-994]EOR01188.1 hypothetical protein J056_004509 [Wallemia ichthyophaga EXF-994]
MSQLSSEFEIDDDHQRMLDLDEIQRNNDEFLVAYPFNFIKWSRLWQGSSRIITTDLEQGIYPFGKGKGKPIEVFIGMTKRNRLEILIPYSMISERFKDIKQNDFENIHFYHFVSPAHFQTLEDFLGFANIQDKKSGIFKINKRYKRDRSKYRVTHNVVLEKKYFEMSRRFYRLIKLADDQLRGSVIAMDWITNPNTNIIQGLSIFVLDKTKSNHYQDWVTVTDTYTENKDEVERRYLKRYVQAILDTKTSDQDECRMIIVKKSMLPQDMDRTKDALKQFLPDNIFEGMQMDISSRVHDELNVIRRTVEPFNIYGITSLIPLYHALCSDVTGEEPSYRRMLDAIGMPLDDQEMVDILENNAVHLLNLADCLLTSTFIDYQKMIQFPETHKGTRPAEESSDEDSEDQDDDEKMENYL